MDGLREPVGDEPAKVYWVRRLILAIVLVGLLLWVVWWLSGLFNEAAQPGTTPSPTSSPSVSESVSEDPARACTNEDLSVVTTTPLSFDGSDPPATFTVTVTLTSDSPCAVDPKVDSKIVVKSGEETWFDSTECPGYAPYGSQTERFILQDEPRELNASWNFGRGDDACVGEPKAKKGFYWVTATVQGVEAEPVQFEVK